MKKIIIKSILIFLIFSNFTFAEDNFFSNWNIIQISKENRSLKLEAKHYKERVKSLDELILRTETENLQLENQVKNLESENKKLNNNLTEIKNKNNSEDFQIEVIKSFTKKYIDMFFSKLNNDEEFIILWLYYLISSLILFLIFLIYTLPLRLIRFIWRKITWYKECNPKLQKDFEHLLKKYHLLKGTQSDFVEKISDDLNYEISELKRLNNSLKNQNINLKDNNNYLKDKVTKDKEEIIFSFENNDNSSNTEKKSKNINIKSKKTQIKNTIKEKSFSFKEKTDLFSKKQENKFFLSKDKKWWLFN
jgi:predicted nuclease with TOPRIM domain